MHRLTCTELTKVPPRLVACSASVWIPRIRGALPSTGQRIDANRMSGSLVVRPLDSIARTLERGYSIL